MRKEDKVIESAISSGVFLNSFAMTFKHRIVTEAEFHRMGVGTPVLDQDFGGAKRGDWIRAVLAPTDRSEDYARDQTCIVHQEVRPRSTGLLGISCGSIDLLPDSVKSVL